MSPTLRRPRLPRLLAAVTATSLLLAACGGADDDGPDADTDATSADGTSADAADPAVADGDGATGADGTTGGDDATSTALPTAVPLPETPAGRQLGWVLATMQPTGGGDPGKLGERFAPSFLEQISAEEVAAGLRELGAQGPWIPVLVDGSSTQLVATVVASRQALGAPERLQVLIGVDAEDRIESLRLVPAPEVAVDDLDDTQRELEALADEVSLLVARIDGTVCSADRDLAADQPRAVASTAKLYVLDAVADAVAAGELAWDDEVALTDTDRSLPTGELQDEPAGTEVTVHDLAVGMMAISDNTATDHLITLVGREAVEAAVRDAGHHDPDLLTPFPRTRELFAVNWDDERRATYAELDGEDEARTFLDALPEGTGGVEVADVAGAAWHRGLDWPASLEDLCLVHAALDRSDPVVAEAVGTNPGLPLDASVWSEVAYKGGSAPGVLALSWSFDRDDGERWFVGIALNDRRPLDEPTAIAVATSTVELVADLGR